MLFIHAQQVAQSQPSSNSLSKNRNSFKYSGHVITLQAAKVKTLI